MNWFPLRNFTHYSLLKGFSKPDELVKKCSENGYKACGICDYKSISGAVTFFQACHKYDVKPIIGCSFDNYELFAKNKDGWFDLIKIVSSITEDGNPDGRILQDACRAGNLVCTSSNLANSPIQGDDFYMVSECLRPTYYTNKEHAELHRIILCSGMKTTMPKIREMLRSDKLFDNQEFFECDDFYLRDTKELSEILMNDAENANVVHDISNKCEEYDILNKPMLPTFPTPNGESEEEYLKELCREGWRNLLAKNNKVKDQENKDKYHQQFLHEFKVIEEAKLFGYFLIVRDIVHFVESNGWISGPGRGSAAGCLISYMIGITKIDPIEFDLLFERFYNSGRNTGDHISLPDIDMDVPGNKRDDIIDYLKETYGHSNVSQMLTFGRLQGRSALKEVLRVSGVCGFGLMNEMTKSIPNEADISDQLAAMDDQDRSIIKWALINNSNELRDYCFINDAGELQGDYAEYFKQAIDMEGTFKTQGKHAAGVVISKEELNRVCPMVNQKSSDEKIAGLEMADLEALGHVKFDVLGINLLDKLMKIKELING